MDMRLAFIGEAIGKHHASCNPRVHDLGVSVGDLEGLGLKVLGGVPDFEDYEAPDPKSPNRSSTSSSCNSFLRGIRQLKL